MKNKIITLLCALTIATVTLAQVGIGTTNPLTTLDVNGAITTRETIIAVAANAASVPANTSMVRLTGVATASITLTVPAAPIAGQRLMIYNNTTGGFGALLNGVSIPENQSAEFVYSNSAWQSLSPMGGTIIPYASAVPVTLTTVAGGVVGTVAMVGFGNSVSAIGLTSGAIELVGGTGVNINYGFSLPRNGLIKSISALYSNTAALSLIGSHITVRAQLYKAVAPSNTFTPIPNAYIDLGPTLNGTVALGYTAYGINSSLAIPVDASSRVIMVFSATATGVSLLNTIGGYVSAGVSVD